MSSLFETLSLFNPYVQYIVKYLLRYDFTIDVKTATFQNEVAVKRKGIK